MQCNEEITKHKEENLEANDNKESNMASQSNQLKQLATITRITKDAIHLKPHVKVRGRPKYSSKFWPSKSKKKSNPGKRMLNQMHRQMTQVSSVVI